MPSIICCSSSRSGRTAWPIVPQPAAIGAPLAPAWTRPSPATGGGSFFFMYAIATSRAFSAANRFLLTAVSSGSAAVSSIPIAVTATVCCSDRTAPVVLYWSAYGEPPHGGPTRVPEGIVTRHRRRRVVDQVLRAGPGLGEARAGRSQRLHGVGVIALVLSRRRILEQLLRLQQSDVDERRIDGRARVAAGRAGDWSCGKLPPPGRPGSRGRAGAAIAIAPIATPVAAASPRTAFNEVIGLLSGLLTCLAATVGALATGSGHRALTRGGGGYRNRGRPAVAFR